METNFRKDEYKDRKFSVSTSILPGIESRGTATIFGSFQNVAWGELVCGQAVNYHVFSLVRDKKGKVSECVIIPAGHWENRDGSARTLGTKEEVERLFEIMQDQLIDAEEVKKREDEKKQSLADMVEERAQRGAEIKAKRQDLENEFQKLSAGLTIDEILNDKALQDLTLKYIVFDRCFPPRIKR